MLRIVLISLAIFGGYTLYQGNKKTVDRAAKTVVKAGTKYATKATKKTINVLGAAVNAGYLEAKE
jgi:hypothetical protein